MEAEKIANLPAEIVAARKRIKDHVLKTPLMFSHYLSQSANVYLKLDNEQKTGSFKLRGAFNKMLTLQEREPEKLAKGFTTASSGNHALACLTASKACKCQLQLYCPNNVSSSKRELLDFMGADLVLFGNDCVETELKARKIAEECGKTYISPYNDWDIIAGQGTIGVEILEDLPEVDCVLVAVGGGGLVAGIGCYLKSQGKDIEVIGCQPSNSKIMFDSILAGKIAHGESYETLSDGTAGDVEDGSITFPLCRDFVDRWILVSEEEIAKAVFWVLDKHHKVIEGAAGVAMAAFLSDQDSFKGKNVAIVICGANISTKSLETILQVYA